MSGTTLRRIGFALVGVLLALTGAACGAQRRPAAIRTIRIDVHYSHFNPASLQVAAGSAVRFTVTNSDPIDHEFIVGDDALQKKEEAGTDVIHNGDMPGRISVPAGATVSTVVSLWDPGMLAYACHLPGHYAYGMKGTLQVQA